VPSGIWAPEEYAKLPRFDGTTGEQAEAGAFGAFMCHSSPERVCAGWAGCHDMEENLAIRMPGSGVDAGACRRYVSPVPLFGSGAEAAEHGLRDVDEPGADARRKAEQLSRLIERRWPS
jgi:hypothetical protein